jgi:hypothetical protein
VTTLLLRSLLCQVPPMTAENRLGSAVGGRPTKAERVAGGIRVDLEDLGRLEVVGRLQEPRAQRDCFVMCGLEVVDPQVQMELLLWGPVRPVRGNMVRRQLNEPRARASRLAASAT